MRFMRGIGLVVVCSVIAACRSSESTSPHVLMDFARASLWDAPVPADDLMGSGVAQIPFPNPLSLGIVDQVDALLAGKDGFATTAGVFFQISTAIDASTLPSIAGSVGSGASAFVVGIEPSAPDFGVRYPLEVSFEPAPDRYGAPNLVTLLPLQGMPLRPGTRYAAVLTTAIETASGEPLAAVAQDALARFPDATPAALGVAADHIAGLTAFTTGNPMRDLETVRAAALARPLPVIDAPFAQTDVFDDYCVYHTTIPMPDWQSGDPPFLTDGGTWQFDGSGQPIFQRTEESDLFLTIPRAAPATAAGYPLVVFIRTGAGGDRPLVDRGQQPGTGEPAIVPGEGPALYFARAGFAGIQVDGPLGGLRNTTDANEDFTIFNINNLGAMRDNIRESAVELDVIARVGVALQVATSDCQGAMTTSTFDGSHVGLMGHSMGSWIEPLAAAPDPIFGLLILSGAGGSWIENILYKQQPAAPEAAVAALLHDNTLTADLPMMSATQWALEPADPAVYTRYITREPPAPAPPRHVLMVQGIVDDYILPRIADATSLSIGLDLAGPEQDTLNDPRLVGELPVGPLLPLDGQTTATLPVASNIHLADNLTATAILTQFLSDGIEDGHEVMFQLDPPKHEYQCMLASWLATGVPTIPTNDTRDAPCPPTNPSDAR